MKGHLLEDAVRPQQREGQVASPPSDGWGRERVVLQVPFGHAQVTVTEPAEKVSTSYTNVSSSIVTVAKQGAYSS